ncbi:MAG: MBL fold metallo-hydrolase [Acidobacteria bacterium]|nr:MBL fold metallo-hydrolase [Acidobacteriota bacterium]
MMLESQPVGPFMMNSYVLGCERTREAVLIDPGYEPAVLDGMIRGHGLQVRHILCTHGHLDHVGAAAEVVELTGAPIWLHRDDLFLYEAMSDWASSFNMVVRPGPPIGHFVEDGEAISFGDYTLRAVHTPGHTPGGMTYLMDQKAFVGDTLFAGSVGRTDLPGGSWEQLMESIRHRLLPLADSTLVYCGHGPSTTIGKERRTNPFLQDLRG